MPEFNCGACGKLLKTPAGSEGKQGRCPHCGGIMHIPGKPAAPTAPAHNKPGNSSGSRSSAPLDLSKPGDSTSAKSSQQRQPPQNRPPQQRPPRPQQQPASQPRAAPQPPPRPAQPGSQPLQPNPLSGPPPSNNPYAAPAPQPGGYGASAGYGSAFRGSPHRGGLVLTLGLVSLISSLGLLVCCICLGPLAIPFALVSLICGIPACFLGLADLKEMKAQVMDPSGHGLTMSGVVTAMIGSILSGLSLVAMIVLLIIGMAAQV